MANFTRVTLSVAEFRARFPEFASISDANIQRKIDEALLIHSIRKLATMYCVAHLLSVDAQAAVISGDASSSTSTVTIHGETQSRQVGPLRETFTTLAESGSASGNVTGNARPQHELTFFGRTEYGRQFIILEARSPRATIGAMVV